MKRALAILAMAFAASGWAATWTDDNGMTWRYTISKGAVSLGLGSTVATASAVPRATTGNLTIPSTINGYPVTGIGRYAFFNCSGLTSVTIPESVTGIGEQAFYDCHSLTSVMIPDSVTTIGCNAFCMCARLESVAIPNSVMCIGHDAFSCCDNLSNVTIGNNVTNIGESAFSSCTNLSSVIIGEKVRSIEPHAFYGCSKLTGLTIPNSVTSIGAGAFYGCNGLTNSVMIPYSVWSIGDSAFGGCRDITSVTIPQSVCFAGLDSVFPDSCQNITNVVVADGVATIFPNAFRNCYGLKSITIPASVANVLQGAFDSCWSLNEVHISDIAKWCSIRFADQYANPLSQTNAKLYLGEEIITELIIPDNVASIGAWAFYNSKLTSFTIPNSVTNIGDYAFSGCYQLTSIDIPSSVATIGNGAFLWCNGLTSVTIPDSVTSIGSRVFYGCSGLASVAMPNSVTSIGDCSFCNCIKLTSIEIPESVTNIGYEAFCGCRSLANITIPNSVASIGAYAFSYCGALGDVTIEAGVTNIGKFAFYGCTNLVSITVPSSVAGIGEYAFGNCSGLTSVILQDGVPKIDNSAFRGCANLVNVSVPASVTRIGDSVFAGCSDELFDTETIAGVKLLDGWVVGYTDEIMATLDLTGIKGVADKAFSGCSSIKSLTVPESLFASTVEKEFPNSYFSITNIVIPEGVGEIGNDVFARCGHLVRVTIPSTVTNIDNKAFSSCENLRELSFACNMTVGELPKARRVGYKFVGWFSEEEGGSQLLAGMDVHSGDVYYARWAEMGSFVLDSLDLAIPDTITVCDEYYGMLDTLSQDMIAAAYDIDGDLIDVNEVYVSSISRADGGAVNGDSSSLYNEYFKYADNYEYCLRAGAYIVTVRPVDQENCSGSATCTVAVEKMNYTEMIMNAYYTTPQTWIECYSTDSYNDSSEVIYLGSVNRCGTVTVSAYDYFFYMMEEDPLRPTITICVDGMQCPSNWYTISPYYSTSYISFLSAGYYEICAEVDGHYVEDDYGYCYIEGGYVSRLFYVAPENIDELPIEVVSDLVYTSEEIKNEGGSLAGCLFGDKVRLSFGEETSLLIENPVAVTNAGIYRLAVGSFLGSRYIYGVPNGWVQYAPDVRVKYGGVKYVYYEVAPRPVVAAQAEFVLPENLAYDGCEKVLAGLTITNDYNGVILQEGVDYDVSYSDNVNPGTATVTVTCKGNYTGTFTKTFAIANADFGLVTDGESGGASGETGTIAGYEGVYDGEGHGLTVDVSAIGDVGVKYSLSEEGPFVDSLLLTNVCDQTVWVELSAFGYNSFTGFAQVVISPKSIEGCRVEVESPVAYDGHAMQAVVSVVDEDLGAELEYGVDYELEYSDNEVVGTAGVKVVGIGNYKGEIDGTFEIVKGTIRINNESTWQWIDAEGFAFDGENKAVAFASDGAVPNEVVEVEITGVTNAVHAGTYTAYANGTITGFKTDDFYNYYYTTVLDNVPCQWQIQSRSCENCDASLTPGVMFYTGGGLEPEVTVVDGDLGRTLSRGVDYDLVFRNNIDIGTAEVEVEFMGDYFGSKALNFHVVDSFDSLPPVSIALKSGIYSGAALLVVNYEGVDGVDWTLRYTLDGSEPTAQSSEYTSRVKLNIAEETWIKVAAFSGDVRISEVAVSHCFPSIASIILGEGSDPVEFANAETNPWEMDDVETSPAGRCTLRSAVGISDGESSFVATVVGKGLLAFKWQTSCEADDDYDFCDHAVCMVDGNVAAQLCGESGWVEETVELKEEGEHTIAWKYVKDVWGDDNNYPGRNGAWVGDVVWTSTSTITLSFDACGGEVEETERPMWLVKPVDALPVPTWAHHDFAGWWTAGGVQVEAGARLYEDTALYAHWTLSKYAVSFDANGGEMEADDRQIEYGAEVGELPVPTWEGREFLGWFTAEGDGDAVSAETRVLDSVSLFAHWRKYAFAVSFDANGGTASENERTVEYGDAIGALPEASWVGREFLGWFVCKTDTQAFYNTVVTSAVSLEARWRKLKYAVVFDACGGSVDTEDFSIEYEDAVGELPVPTWEGREFLGWFTAADGGEQVDADMQVTDAVSLFAHWRKYTFTVSFDPNGGDVEAEDRVVEYGDTIGELPVPEYAHMEFLGWHTPTGVRVAADTVVTEDMPLKAEWRYEFTFGGDGVWNDLGEGVWQSGETPNSATNSVSMEVEGEGTIAFCWKVSCEDPHVFRGIAYRLDYLAFAIDGEEKRYIYGITDWASVSFAVVGLGSHVFEWLYVKDSEELAGEDCGWIRYVEWTPKDTVSIDVGGKGTVEESASGGYFVTAKEGETLTEGDFKFGAIAKEAYKIEIAEGGKSATVSLNPPAVGVAPGEEATKDEDDDTGLLVEVPENEISAKPTPEAGEAVGALPVKAYPGLYYQASWGDDLNSLTTGEKVQATGDSLYLGVIKQKGDKGFYKLSVSEK